jgi:hypothetical protein
MNLVWSFVTRAKLDYSRGKWMMQVRCCRETTERPLCRSLNSLPRTALNNWRSVHS